MISDYPPLPEVSHIQQVPHMDLHPAGPDPWNLKPVALKLKEESFAECKTETLDVGILTETMHKLPSRPVERVTN